MVKQRIQSPWQLLKKVLAFHVVLWYYKWALDLKNAICADSSTG